MGGQEVLVQGLLVIIVVAHFITIYHDSAVLYVMIGGDIFALGIVNRFDGGDITGKAVAI